MTDLRTIAARERDIQRRWHAAHVDRFQTDALEDDKGWRDRRITPQAAETRAFIDALRRSHDLSAFQQGTDRWFRSFNSGYAGVGGQMIINQINKLTPDPEESADLLVDVLAPPTDLDDAVRKIRLLADHLEAIRVGSHPSRKRAPFVASYYWALEDPSAWPVAWFSSMEYLAYVTGVSEFDDQGDRYSTLYNFVTDVDGDTLRFEEVAAWWANSWPVLVDDSLCDRASLRESANERDDDPELYRQNAQTLVAVSKHIGTALADAVSEAAGRTLKARKPAVMWDKTWPRGDIWVDWRVPETYGLAVRVWLNSYGVAVGLRPYPDGDAQATERALGVIEKSPLPGYEILAGGASKVGRDVGFAGGGSGEVIYARWFDRDSLATLDLPSVVLTAARELSPLIAELNGEAPTSRSDDALAAIVAEFKASTGYPTPRHEQDEADRRDFVKLLDSEALLTSDPTDLRLIWSSDRYGGTGPMAVLNASIRDADEAESGRIIETINYLCWGEDEPAARIDRVLADEDRRVRGLGESVMMKLLAICHPKRFITVYPYTGPKGKLRMLELLGLAPPLDSSPGVMQIAANDLLAERLRPYFPDDLLGAGSFLYWHAETNGELEDEHIVDPLEELAEELLVDRSYLDDIVALLDDKKQVVFYGPPGTGKTYFARKLAEALVPDAERRPIVQFHPSTSYEDFFEGFRPETDANGGMVYRLRKGPLADLAARASEAPGRHHLMIIDEINRANLPKVLGELLFLFEYRDTPVRTLYRPDDPFELPKNVWFIGTMNTADRSIALVDAALRRRFHFIPFFPNRGPVENLLERWLEREGEPAWVGELVAQVNDELQRELGGPHLQLGPSHFMKKNLDRDSLQRIWAYDIEPFIEDQFFGDEARITMFRFQQVWERYSDVAPESITDEPAADDIED